MINVCYKYLGDFLGVRSQEARKEENLERFGNGAEDGTFFYTEPERILYKILLKPLTISFK
ncbi:MULTISPECIES: hypothetical protein [unclassified Okeania]|uniref:Uncharacterized protein n=1 Tax=Okeania hirsuta TaxID=1458930 RepID=A0A3N6PPG2_9CYAN|nr:MULTISPECIES: hypothetical protein [unclassified Okeania]NET21365.1 hypothetical protein [Okeania sp. SIO1H5]NET94528.1 hypothetical protein [Okeania sp. SIO1H2]RQH34491.1 hypothetical protein D5R40_20795 [Okeania hirsuta]